jgi:hypothetical protein
MAPPISLGPCQGQHVRIGCVKWSRAGRASFQSRPASARRAIGRGPRVPVDPDVERQQWSSPAPTRCRLRPRGGYWQIAPDATLGATHHARGGASRSRYPRRPRAVRRVAKRGPVPRGGIAPDRRERCRRDRARRHGVRAVRPWGPGRHIGCVCLPSSRADRHAGRPAPVARGLLLPQHGDWRRPYVLRRRRVRCIPPRRHRQAATYVAKILRGAKPPTYRSSSPTSSSSSSTSKRRRRSVLSCRPRSCCAPTR